MELPVSCLEALNTRMPPGFVIETLDPRAKHRRTEAESLVSTYIPTDPPRPRTVKEIPLMKPQPPVVAEGPERVYEVLAKVRNHPNFKWVERGGIDLGCIERKLLREEFVDVNELAGEVRKAFGDARMMSQKGSDVYMSLLDVHSLFEYLMKGMESLPLGKPAASMSYEAKQTLREKIRCLDRSYLRGIYDIVKKSVKTGSSSAEFEFDLDSLPPSVCKGLAEYVDICLQKQHVDVPADLISSSESEATYQDHLSARAFDSTARKSWGDFPGL